jgi:hypothetical protein
MLFFERQSWDNLFPNLFQASDLEVGEMSVSDFISGHQVDQDDPTGSGSDHSVPMVVLSSNQHFEAFDKRP